MNPHLSHAHGRNYVSFSVANFVCARLTFHLIHILFSFYILKYIHIYLSWCEQCVLIWHTYYLIYIQQVPHLELSYSLINKSVSPPSQLLILFDGERVPPKENLLSSYFLSLLKFFFRDISCENIFIPLVGKVLQFGTICS